MFLGIGEVLLFALDLLISRTSVAILCALTHQLPQSIFFQNLV